MRAPGGQRLDIVQVMASLDGKAAGPSYSVPRLCEALAARGHSVSLLAGTAQADPAGVDGAPYEDCRYRFEHTSIPVLGKLGVSSGLRQALLSRAVSANVFHTHGLWRFANVYPAAAARRAGKPLVLSPRGMLAPSALDFSALSKRLFWTAAQREAVKAVSAFHATSEQEYADIRAYGLDQPVAIIPNGIDLPDLAPRPPLAAPTTPAVVFLGRLHPVKAIDRLVKAWSLLGEATQGWQLRIVGPVENGYDRELQGLIATLGLKNVALEGPVAGDEKWRLLQGAELTVLPSLSENFGVSVAESLAVGTPAIASRGTPWQGLADNGCGWWVDNSPETLAATLSGALQLSAEQRATMGQRGRAWMQRDFSWDGIASKMAEVYSWLANAGERPEYVRTE